MIARAVAGVAVLAALVYAPIDLLHVERDVRNAHAQPRGERLLAPAASVGIEDPLAVERAAAVIPRSATYAVVSAVGVQAATWVPFWAAYTLLPRRQAARPQDAQWILGYRTAPRATGLRLGRATPLGEGVWAARVLR